MKTPERIQRDREIQQRYRDKHREKLRAKWRENVQSKKAAMSAPELEAAQAAKAAYDAEYRQKNKEQIAADKADYYATEKGHELRHESYVRFRTRHAKPVKPRLSPEQLKQNAADSKKKWLAKNPDHFRNAYARRMKSDPAFRILKALRARVRHLFTGKHKSAKTLVLVGCTAEELKKHVESLWKPGMSWSNYGRNGWHLDHVIPCALFDLTKPEQQRQCFHYSNVAPLWQLENLQKKDKLPAGMAHPNPPVAS